MGTTRPLAVAAWTHQHYLHDRARFDGPRPALARATSGQACHSNGSNASLVGRAHQLPNRPVRSLAADSGEFPLHFFRSTTHPAEKGSNHSLDSAEKPFLPKK